MPDMRDDLEWRQWYLDALREVDELCPGSTPVAPSPPTAWQLEQAAGAQNAYANVGMQQVLAAAQAQQGAWLEINATPGQIAAMNQGQLTAAALGQQQALVAALQAQQRRTN